MLCVLSRTLGATVLAAVALATSAIAADLVVMGSDAGETITGTDASEAIFARGGADTVNAGGGDDEIDGGDGGDVISGGPGTDVVLYSGSTPVDVTLDALANDGRAGEGDNVLSDVEDVYGGSGDDRLVGNDAPNTIDGADGADRITGGGGTDVLIGGPGDDTLDARDGAIDRVDCGDGKDTAIIDKIDLVAADCEIVSKPIETIPFGMTLNANSKRLILSTVVSMSSVKISCFSGCKPGSARSKTILRRKPAKLQKGNVISFKLPPRIKGATIEVGVTAPGASTRCVRYKVSSKFRYTVQRNVACVTAAATA